MSNLVEIEGVIPPVSSALSVQNLCYFKRSQYWSKSLSISTTTSGFVFRISGKWATA